MATKPRLTASQRRRVELYGPEGQRRWREERRALLEELQAAGWSVTALAELMGVSRQRIQQYLADRHH